jgi:hypothetical protein
MSHMSDNYVIEIRPKPAGRTVQAGIVVRDGHGFRFFAADDAFFSLERRLFKNPKAAEEAVLRSFAAERDAAAKKSIPYRARR